ncbi:MAG: hypothetical protein ACREFX_15825 [Opitutaceae bacterium]
MAPPRRLYSAADVLTTSHMPVAQAAVALAREPTSPITRTMKLWGDDERPFKNLIRANTAAAREWRRMMGRIVGHLECLQSDEPVYRGWSFPSAKMRASFIDSIRRRGGFVNRRIGMSASRARRVSTGRPFLNRFGLVWEIRRHRLARDVSPIFHAIGAKFPRQREVIFPRGCQFVLAEPPRQLRVVRSGQTLRVPYLVLHEV